MAFSSSSFFAGVGTVVAAISLGFAGGAMLTTSAVQPPNRLERVTSSAPLPSTNSASEQSGMTTPPAQQQQQPQTVAAAPATDSQPVQQPQPAAPAVAKTNIKTDMKTDIKADAKTEAKTDAAANARQPTNVQQQPSVAKSEDAAPAKNERTNARPAEANREVSRKRAEERKFSERKRRQQLDEATDIVRQMPRDSAVDRVVEEDDAPHFSDGPPRRFGFFGADEDSPRAMPPPPRFGLFGN